MSEYSSATLPPKTNRPQVPPRNQRKLPPSAQPKPAPRRKSFRQPTEQAGDYRGDSEATSKTSANATIIAILRHTVQGLRSTGGPSQIQDPSAQTVNVISGELVISCFIKDQRFNYQLYRDRSIFLLCKEDDVSPLQPEQLVLLEAIKNPADRLATFTHKLEWGLSLKEGSVVSVTTQGAKPLFKERAVVRYKGKKGSHPGTFFGVEIMDDSQRAARAARVNVKNSDGTFEGQQYFTCDIGAGLFVTLAQLSPLFEKIHNRPLNRDKKGCEEPKIKDCPQASAAPSQTKEEMKHDSFAANSASASNLTPQPVAKPVSQPSLEPHVHTKVLEELQQQSQFRERGLPKEALPKAPAETTGGPGQGGKGHGSNVYALPQQGGGRAVEGAQIEQHQYHEYEQIDEGKKRNVKVRHQHEYAEIKASVKKVPQAKSENQHRPKHVYTQIVDCQVTNTHITKVASKDGDSCARKTSGAPLPNIPTTTPDCSPAKTRQYVHLDKVLPLNSSTTKPNNMAASDTDLKGVPFETTTQSVILPSRTTKIESETETRIKELCQENISLRSQIKELQVNKTEMVSTLREKEEEIKKLSATYRDEIRCRDDQITAFEQCLTAKAIFTQMQPHDFDSTTWTIPRAEIMSIPKKKVDKGAWGTIYSAKFHSEMVAIKIAHKKIFHEFTVKILKREVAIMSFVHHPNVVRFIGAVWDDAVENQVDTPIIVSELMDTNLRTAYITLSGLTSTALLISVFRDVAYALHYLHNLPIIHRDISAPNILLNISSSSGRSRVVAKVSDLGSANLATLSQTAAPGCIIYSAPEVFPSGGICELVKPPRQTPKVDVYSYGILMLEVVTRKMPNTRESAPGMLQEVKERWSAMHELILWCTKTSPDQRPTMADILTRLNNPSFSPTH